VPIFSIGLDASYESGTVYSLQTILFLRKLCQLTFFLQTEVIHGLIKFCTRLKKKKKNADSANTTSMNEGKDVVLSSAPPNGCRDTQHVTWRIK
jgi:hypothetical protein